MIKSKRVNKPEGDLVKIILKYLTSRGIYCWRNNTGTAKIGWQPIKFGHPGSGDIIGIMPDGRFLSVEAKATGGKEMEKQTIFRHELARRGGVSILAFDLETVVRELDVALATKIASKTQD